MLGDDDTHPVSGIAHISIDDTCSPHARSMLNDKYYHHASIELAEQKLGFDYVVLNVRKAIIALDGDVEVAVYEFACDRIDGLYYYYIDAQDLDIVKILKVVDLNGTQLLV